MTLPFTFSLTLFREAPSLAFKVITSFRASFSFSQFNCTSLCTATVDFLLYVWTSCLVLFLVLARICSIHLSSKIILLMVS